MDKWSTTVYADTAMNPGRIAERIESELEGKPTEPMLLVREMFDSWQGEAPFTGRQAFFLRLGGCNRGPKTGTDCEACDTSFEVAKSKAVAVSHLRELIIRRAEANPHLLVVITGGEPLLQSEGLVPLLRSMPGYANHTVQIETNGDLLPRFAERMAGLRDQYSEPVIHVVVSPKGKLRSSAALLLQKFQVEPGTRPVFGTIRKKLWQAGVSSLTFRPLVSCDDHSPYGTITEEYMKAMKAISYGAPGSIPVYISALTYTESDPHMQDSVALRNAQVRDRVLKLAARHNAGISMQTQTIWNTK